MFALLERNQSSIQQATCEECGHEESTTHALALHIIAAHLDLAEEAKKAVKTIKSLAAIVRVNSGDLFDCVQCNFHGKSRKSLSAHMRHRHRGEATVPESPAETTFDTEETSKFETVESDDKVDTFNCPQCNYNGKSLRSLRTHKWQRHASTTLTTSIPSIDENVYVKVEDNLIETDITVDATPRKRARKRSVTEKAAVVSPNVVISEREDNNLVELTCSICSYTAKSAKGLRAHTWQCRRKSTMISAHVRNALMTRVNQ